MKREYQQLFIMTLLFGVMCLPCNVYCQDIEKITEAKPLQVNGGVNLQGSSYKVFNSESRQDPFYGSLNANINFILWDIIDVPFFMQWTTQEHTFNKPSYNQFGISPRYKYLTVHGGYRSMFFSNYSLSGLTFLGGGIEVLPEDKPIKFMLMTGKLAKAIPVNTNFIADYSNSIFNQPGYERWCYGGKLMTQLKKNSLDIILLKIKDDEKSIPDPPYESMITPKENIVFSLLTKHAFYESLLLSMEYSISALTRDVRLDEKVFDGFTYINNLGRFFIPRQSTIVKPALVSSLNYSKGNYSGNVSFKRVAPNYESLGTPYLENDIMDITGGSSIVLFQNKLSTSATAGVQHNNLENTMNTVNRRLIINLQLNYSPSDKLSFFGNYANFSSSSEPVTIAFRDTFKYAQITANISLGVNLMLRSTQNSSHTLLTQYANQKVNTLNQTTTMLQESGTLLNTLNLSHNYRNIPNSFYFSESILFTRYQMQYLGIMQSLGPAIAAGKMFFEHKMNTTLTINYLINEDPSIRYRLLSSQLNVQYTLSAKHQLNFNAQYLWKQQPAKLLPMQEWRMLVGYSCRL